MNSYLDKFREVATKAGTQATAFANTASQQLTEQAKIAQAGFSLPKECDRAATILQSFLADPSHPDTVSLSYRSKMSAEHLLTIPIISLTAPGSERHPKGSPSKRQRSSRLLRRQGRLPLVWQSRQWCRRSSSRRWQLECSILYRYWRYRIWIPDWS